MVFSWEDSRRAFADAVQWFVRTTALVGDRWNRPGLGEWGGRALVGHTSRSLPPVGGPRSRSLLTVETSLARPAAAVELASAVDYFRATRAAAADAAVAARGRDAGSALGTDPAGAVADIAARVLELVDGQDGTELLTTIAGGMRLSDYLPTRTFELAVHTTDLATALGAPLDVPATAAAQALRGLADLAASPGGGGAAARRGARGPGGPRGPRRPAPAGPHRPDGPPRGLLAALTRPDGQ